MKRYCRSSIGFRFVACVVTLLALHAGIALKAQALNAEGAMQVANSFFGARNPQQVKGNTRAVQALSPVYVSADTVQAPVFVFQNNQSGFVVVSQHGSDFAVVGYTTDGRLDPENMPPQLSALLRYYEDSVVSVSQQPLPAATPVMTPLLDEAGVSLNQFTHENVGGCPSGCVATAFAQIMAYYKHPSRGTGSHCYTDPKHGQLCADFGNTNYNWNTPTDADYKLLSYHVGIALNMGYCAASSGSHPIISDYYSALDQYFGYQSEDLGLFAADTRTIQDIISMRKPVYAEFHGYPVGHAMVVDGYDSNGFFHLNFGWGGSSNGYFQLNNSTGVRLTSGYRFGTNILKAVLTQPGPVYLNKTDSLALVAINNNLSKLNWELSDSRKRNGITTINGSVIGLEIKSMSEISEGSIPEEIGNLKELIRLNISGNLHGTIPQSISGLTRLEALKIHNMYGTLSDTLPGEIGNLTNLKSLHIYNALTGQIPSSIGRLSELETIYMPTGTLEGEIPDELYSLNKLTELTLNNHQLSGSLSPKIGNLKELQYLQLLGNQLTGTIPATIGELTQLITLDLATNKLTGAIPVELKNCSQLTYLRLQNNQLEGMLPPVFGTMKQLHTLYASNNKLTALSEDVGNASRLVTLAIDNNLLTALPDSLNELRLLETLTAGSNQLSRLPENMNRLTNLAELDLSDNALTEFHEDLIFLPDLSDLNLSKNKLTRLPLNASHLSMTRLYLNDNELSGSIPAALFRTQPGYYRFQNNRFVYNDLPSGDDFTNFAGTQQPIPLSKTIFKGFEGDTLTIDIRQLSTNLNKNDSYVWCEFPAEKTEYMQIIELEHGPVLHIELSEQTIGKKYYCRITNDSSATYDFNEEYYDMPCLGELITDTVSLGFSTDEEFLDEKYPDSYIVSSETLVQKEISDKTVTLISPRKVRGDIVWQGSADGTSWHDLSPSMTQNDLKANLVSVKTDELVVSPRTPAYYRSAVFDTNCEPLYSDTVKINPYGKVLCDTTINVRTESVTIKNDSIEVTIPQGITEDDFRLTIVKLDNPPAKPDSVPHLSAVYDVTVSFGEEFYLPIVLKFKTINKETFNLMGIDNYQAVYFNDANQEWTPYPDATINLTDTTLSFGTYHLTKLGYFEFNEMNYSHIFVKGRVNVIYRYGDGYDETKFLDSYDQQTKLQGLQSWHTYNTDPDKDGNPYMIQDIAEYMNQIISKTDSLGLETPGLRFNVYVKNIGNYGKIGFGSYLSGRGYFIVDPQFNFGFKDMEENRNMFKMSLAHEYTHYTMDYYMTVLIQNYFWQEAVAPEGGRMYWNGSNLPVPEPEKLLKERLIPLPDHKTIFDILSTTWFNDYNLPVVSKIGALFSTVDYNLAGLFFHYMQNYRKGSLLDLAALIKETPYLQTWLGYLESFISKNLNSTTGAEFADYVLALFRGENSNFTVLNQDGGNPLKHVINNTAKGRTFATVKNYKFDKPDSEKETDSEEITVTVPYLAARMQMLNNLTKDKAVLIRYKKLAENEKNERTFYGRYDVKMQQMNLVEITDSTDFSILLEAMTDKSNTDFRNTGFLLFINAEKPGWMSSNFEANYELKAMPVPNITALCYAHASVSSIHNYDDGNKRIFYIPGKVTNTNVNINFSTDYFETTMDLIEDTIVRVNCSFTEKTTVDNGANLPGTIQETEKTQVIEYDFITGAMMIHQTTRTANKWSEYFDKTRNMYIPGYTHEVVVSDQKMWLAKVLDLVPDKESWGVSTLFFGTYSTEETMKTVQQLSETTITTTYDEKGNETDSRTIHYLDTEYTGTIKMNLWLNNQ
jgi:Leucine-rich repeat (LRR) protein